MLRHFVKCSKDRGDDRAITHGLIPSWQCGEPFQVSSWKSKEEHLYLIKNPVPNPKVTIVCFYNSKLSGQKNLSKSIAVAS